MLNLGPIASGLVRPDKKKPMYTIINLMNYAFPLLGRDIKEVRREVDAYKKMETWLAENMMVDACLSIGSKGNSELQRRILRCESFERCEQVVNSDVDGRHARHTNDFEES